MNLNHLPSIATAKIGGDSSISNLGDTQIIPLIIEAIKGNSRITRNQLARILGFQSVKAIPSYLNKAPKLKFVGRGKNGHLKFLKQQLEEIDDEKEN